MPAALPSFAIVTPSFQHRQYLEQTIQSVLSQNYPGLDYWVIDGGSKDGTVELLRQHELRLRWISEPDRGQSDAISKGFAKSRGEILGWLNSDDEYAPGALAAVADIFARHPGVEVVYGNARFIDAQGNPIAPCAHIEPFSAYRLLHYADFLVQPAAFFRRSAFDAVGGLDCSLHWAMDYDLWLKLAARGDFFYLPKMLAHYRWLGTSKTAGGGETRLDEVRTVVRRYGARDLPAYFRLEAVRMHLAEAMHGGVGSFFSHAASAAGAVLLSPRAFLSLLSPQTWRTIWTGQLLRRRARQLEINPGFHPSDSPPHPADRS